MFKDIEESGSDYSEIQAAQEEYKHSFLTALGNMISPRISSRNFLMETNGLGNEVALHVDASDENPLKTPPVIHRLFTELYGKPAFISEATIMETEIILNLQTDDPIYEDDSMVTIFNTSGFVDRSLVFNIPQGILRITRAQKEFVPLKVGKIRGKRLKFESRQFSLPELFGLIEIVDSAGIHPEMSVIISRQEAE